MSYTRKGFTLIELIVVVIIIGVLASVAAPIMSGVQARAICSEAAVGMSAIRLAIQEYYTEYGSYGSFATSYFLNDSANASSDPKCTGLSRYMDVNSLNGQYFQQQCYYIWVDGSAGCGITCFLDPVTDHPADLVGYPYANGLYNLDNTKKILYDPGSPHALNMNFKTGKVIQQNMSKSGYPSS